MVSRTRACSICCALLVFIAMAYSSAQASIITQSDSCNITSNNDLCQTSATDLLATASVTLNTATQAFSLTYTLQNLSTTNSATLSAFTLQLFDSGFTLNPLDTTGVPSGWIVTSGAKENNALTKFDCHTATGIAGWLCVSDQTATGAAGPLTVNASSTLTFTFGGTLDSGNTLVSPFDLMTKGIYTDGVKYAISSSMVTPGGPPPHEVPEPSSLFLLGSGLLAAGSLLRRRFKS